MTEVKLWAICIPFEISWQEMLDGDISNTMAISKLKGCAGINPDALHGMTNFLFCSPEARNEAFPIVRRFYPQAMIVANTAHVDEKWLKRQK